MLLLLQIYRGPETRHTIYNLCYGVGYLFKVCPIRIRSNGEEIHGQFSPVLHHQLTPHRTSTASSHGGHMRHGGHDEVDGSYSSSSTRTLFAGNVVNSRGELILANASAGYDGHHQANPNANSAAQTLLHLPKGANLMQTVSELFEADSSKAILFVLIFIVLSMIVAACLK